MGDGECLDWGELVWPSDVFHGRGEKILMDVSWVGGRYQRVDEGRRHPVLEV